MSTDWQGMAESLIIAVNTANIPVDAKEEILFAALHNSPLALSGGDVTFSEMLISMHLRDPDRLPGSER